MPRFSVVYYSDNSVSAPLQRCCLSALAKSAEQSGGEIIAVTWTPLYADAPVARRIVWENHARLHSNMYLQILAGIGAAGTGLIALAEHDVLYPAGYFDAMIPAAAAGLTYNSSVWGLNTKGFFRPQPCHLLSNCGGPKERMRERIAGKLNEACIRGGVLWAEPSGDSEFASAHPAIDIRHGSNFTGDREAPDGQYFSTLEYWGDAVNYIGLFSGRGSSAAPGGNSDAAES